MFNAIFNGQLGAVLAPFENRTEHIGALLRSGDAAGALRLVRDAPVDDVLPNVLLSGGEALVHLAATHNAVELLVELLIRGADVGLLSSAGNGPLHYAAMRGHRAAVELLLRCGADASIPNADGLLSVELAPSSDIEALLLQDRSAAYSSSLPQIRERLRERNEHTPISDSKHSAGLSSAPSPTPAHDDLDARVLAAARETARSYKSITSAYANMQMVVKCCSSSNPNLLGALRKKLSAEPLLALSRTCGLGPASPDGFTPLHVAAAANNCDAINLLLGLATAPVSAWVLDLQGRTPLHVAAGEGREQAVLLLREVMLRERPGRDPIGPDAPTDLTGTTPLGWASFKLDRRPPLPIETALFSPGDRTILPVTPFREREGNSRRSRLTGVSGVSFGYSAANGWRPNMEDTLFARCPLSDLPAAAFGVMDGHGGDFTAAFLAHTLPEVLEKTLRSAAANGQLSADHILAAVTEAFSSAESQLQSLPRMRVDVETTKNGRRITPVIDKSGSTAIVCCVTSSHIVVANVGDSRAILGRRSRLVCDGIEVVAMSRDHKPSLPEERARIEAAGATVVPVGEGLGYEVGVAGTELRLRMSRSFGDFYLKQTEGLAPHEQPICAVPELELLPRSPEDAFVVIACDGVWDVMTNQEVADSVASSLRAGGSRSPAEACDNLLRACLERGSTDNMTALVILLESSAKDTLASQEADTPLVHLMSSVSIGSAMRSVGSPSVEEENAEDSESDSCKKNLTLEFE